MDPFQFSFLKFCCKIHSRQMETIQRKSNAFNIAIVLNAIKEEVKLANVFSSLIQAFVETRMLNNLGKWKFERRWIF